MISLTLNTASVIVVLAAIASLTAVALATLRTVEKVIHHFVTISTLEYVVHKSPNSITLIPKSVASSREIKILDNKKQGNRVLLLPPITSNPSTTSFASGINAVLNSLPTQPQEQEHQPDSQWDTVNGTQTWQAEYNWGEPVNPTWEAETINIDEDPIFFEDLEPTPTQDTIPH